MRAYMEHWVTLANNNKGVLPIMWWGDWVCRADFLHTICINVLLTYCLVGFRCCFQGNFYPVRRDIC